MSTDPHADDIRTEYGVRFRWDDGTVEDPPVPMSRALAFQRVEFHRAKQAEVPGWRVTAELVRREVRTTPWMRTEETE